MDIKCVVCGEPWEAYGVNHGDMLSWEAKLFRQGAGCPSCEGQPNGWQPETINDIENGDRDPIERLHAWEDASEGKAPKWTRPEDPKHWECDGCGVQVRTDLDTNELIYYCPWGSASRYKKYEFERNGTPEKKPAHTFDHGMIVCEFCLESCEKCGAALSHKVEGDVYDDGYVWTVAGDHEHCYCADCHTEAEDEAAQETWRVCYSDSERLEYIRDNRYQFKFRSFADLLGCVRGKYFAGYASELLS